MEDKNMKKNNNVEVKGNGEVLGGLPATPLDVLLNFLPVKDIAQLSGANKWLHKTIIGDQAKKQSGNPFAKEKIRIAKIRFDEKIYKVLDKAANTQSQELLNDYKEAENKAGDYFVINQLGNLSSIDDDDSEESEDEDVDQFRNLSGGYTDIFVTVILEQLMFFDIWSMDKSLSGQDQSSMIYLQDFLNKDEIKARKKMLFGKQYTIDNLSRYDWCDVFVDFVGIYFQKIKEDLSKSINFGKDIKAKITSEFVKFWLWQLSQLDAEIKKQENELGEMEERGGVYSDCRDIIEMMESSLFDPNKNFSITFEEFINNLDIRELQEFLFDNKHNFATRFRDKILDNINLIFQRILKSKSQINKQEPIDNIWDKILDNINLTFQRILKSKNQINKQEPIDNIKKLLCNLMTQPKLIDKVKITLPEQKNFKLSELKITIGDGADATSESLETLKLKLKLLDDNYRKNQCLHRMSCIVSYLDEYYIGNVREEIFLFNTDYDNETKFYTTKCTEQKKRIFLDFAEYFCASNVDFQEIKDNIYKLKIDHLNYGYNKSLVEQIVSRSQYTWEQLKSGSYAKFEEDITKIKVDLDIDHGVNINNGNEIQDVEEQEANPPEDKIQDKIIDLRKNDEVDQNIISHGQVEDLSKSEVDTNTVGIKIATDNRSSVNLNENKNLVNRNDNNEVDQNIISHGQVEDLSKSEVDTNTVGIKIATDNRSSVNLNENKNLVNRNDNNKVDQNIISHEQVEDLSKSEVDTNTVGIKIATDNRSSVNLNENKNLVNKNDNNKVDLSEIKNGEPDIGRIGNNGAENVRLSSKSKENQNPKKQTVQKNGFCQFLEYIFVWLGNKIKSGLMAIKNFIVPLIFKNVPKDQFNKTLDTHQNESENIGYSNSKETKVPNTVNQSNDILQYRRKNRFK